MKKTFLAKRNALLSFANISWGACALAGAVFLLLLRLLTPNFFWYVFTPVFHFSDTIAGESHAFFNSFGDTAKLALQNEKVTSENTVLAIENQALLQRVTNLSGLGKETGGIIASVVARPPLSPYDTLVLSRGSIAGVRSGMEAFGEGGIPLGMVSSVLADFSRVTLFSAPNMVVHGWVGHTNLPLTILGSGAGVMSASLARSAGVKVGDVVFAPGAELLPIGNIIRIDSDPSSPSVTLRIQPILNLFSVTQVTLRATGAAFPNSLSWATSTMP